MKRDKVARPAWRGDYAFAAQDKLGKYQNARCADPIPAEADRAWNPTFPHRNLSSAMATYISLIRFTEKGVAQIRKSIDRAAAFDRAAEAAGVKIVGQYWTIGGYDGVLIVSAPTEKKALHWLVALVEGANVRTETLQAFDAAQFAAILGES